MVGGGERRMSDVRNSRYGTDNSRGLNYLTGANSTIIQHNRGRTNTISNTTNPATTTEKRTNPIDRRRPGEIPQVQNLIRSAPTDSFPAVLLPMEDDGEVSMEEEMIEPNLEIEKDKGSELPSSDEEEVTSNLSDNTEET